MAWNLRMDVMQSQSVTRAALDAGDWPPATASVLTAICDWSPGQTSHVPVESAIFCKSEWKSGFRRDWSLLGCSLYPLLVQWEHWDVGGNPTELKRDKEKRVPVRARAHNHFHTLFFLVKVFAVNFLIRWIDEERAQVVWCVSQIKIPASNYLVCLLSF